MAPNDHSALIRAAAGTVLSPLGFQQKGRSRVWFADRGLWMLLVEFQPSGFGKGSYLNIAASWFWHSESDWQFDYMKRASGFVPFESMEQFRPEAERLAKLAGAEAAKLDKEFASLKEIADHLKEQTKDRRRSQNPWTLYHAAIVATLTGDQEFSLKCFGDLASQEAQNDWHEKLQDEAVVLAKLVPERKKFQAAILAKVADTRTRLKLAPLRDRF